ncbi:hypothetical protein CYMTET_49407 [Cymbomonas tetramitiformis]|uniref:Reverse transcriptase domain-containing protein n=1 Tax=Cymbomonas tetramitiformis TaxID=36881 RepID=A0AAE0BS77_9CHLO|nr:hypothetical protein CYMTET_49407 [Cymbomonas tetramitiformis]
MATANEAAGVRSEEAMKSAYSDLRLVTRILAMGHGVEKKCDGMAPGLDRCLRFFEAADLQSAVEMLTFGLLPGGFTPAVRNGRGKVTEKAIVKPPATEQTAFVAALVEAAEQCVEVLVGELGFKLPEVPQQSASEYRTSDKRAREDDDENEEEEQADAGLFEGAEEVATGPKPANKKAVVEEEKEEVQRPVPPVLQELAGGKGETARTGKVRKPERTWSAKFLAMLTAVGVSLASYGVPEAEHQRYMRDVEAVGAMVSPLTERKDRWAQAAWGLPGAEAVVRGIATGFEWQLAESTEFFHVENYVPPQHEEEVAMKLQEEEDAGRMVRTDAGSVPGISALGIVLRVVDGKVKERIVHDLSRPVGLSMNDNCAIDKRRFQTVETAFGLMRSYSYMAKIDLKSAYRFVGIATRLFRFLASEFRDVLKIDTRFPFGAKVAPGLFSDITQLVQLMMQQRGFPGVVVYLDDFILITDTEEACQQGFEMLIELVEYLGFEVAPEKVESPWQDIVFLGVRLQSNQSGLGVVAMSMDESRVQRVALACREMVVLPTMRVKEVE